MTASKDLYKQAKALETQARLADRDERRAEVCARLDRMKTVVNNLDLNTVYACENAVRALESYFEQFWGKSGVGDGGQ
jgi:hypothetical protein